MADSPEPERELDGDAASKAVSEAFDRARANLHGGERGGKTMRLLQALPPPTSRESELLAFLDQLKKDIDAVLHGGIR